MKSNAGDFAGIAYYVLTTELDTGTRTERLDNVNDQAMNWGADGWRTSGDEKSNEMKQVRNMTGNCQQNKQTNKQRGCESYNIEGRKTKQTE